MEATTMLHDAIQNSRIAMFEGEGDIAMNTAPDIFVEHVLAFVRETS